MDHIVKFEVDKVTSNLDQSLAALSRLFAHLNQESIRYCHWKSNLRLIEALQGETDLDLLVDRRHSGKFRQILLQHDIKPVQAAHGRRYPALEDYLGFDVSSGKFFHIHVHYQLVLGEQYVKNYRIPIEDKVLDSAKFLCGVKVPAEEIELIILCIRALLKYRDRDVIKDYFSIRYPGIPGHIRKELERLIDRTSIESVDEVLTNVFSFVPKEIILVFISMIENDPRNGRKFFILRKNLRISLRAYQRKSRTVATWIYFRELWQRRNSLFPTKNQGKMTFSNGGITMALVGVDGAGKSTLHQHLIAWLSWKMDVRGFYMGSKQPSRASDLLYLAFRMFRRGHRSMYQKFGVNFPIAVWLDSIRRNLLFAHYVSIGNDRFERYLAATSLSSEGSIVIYDRFPLEQVSTQPDYRLMDGPQSPISGEKTSGMLNEALIAKEISYYPKMHLPDYLLVLDVDPEISIQRKPDHKVEILSAKNRAIKGLLNPEIDTQNTELIYIDANLPFQDVLRQLKSEVWEIL